MYIASILKEAPHLAAIVESAEAILQGIDLAPVLVYLIDTTSAEALPYLAEQFGVLGYGGFILAEDEAQQRALLKQALRLQKQKGTPWAIKQALLALDFGEPEIVEPSASGYSLVLDGTWSLDGSVTLAGSSAYTWATFDVVFDIGETRGITDAFTQTAIKIVEAYKNARSRLVGISYKATLTDTITPTETLAYDRQVPPIAETASGFILDGSVNLDGSRTLAGTIAETATISIYGPSGLISIGEL